MIGIEYATAKVILKRLDEAIASIDRESCDERIESARVEVLDILEGARSGGNCAPTARIDEATYFKLMDAYTALLGAYTALLKFRGN